MRKKMRRGLMGMIQEEKGRNGKSRGVYAPI